MMNPITRITSILSGAVLLIILSAAMSLPVQAQVAGEEATVEGEILLRLTNSAALPALLTTYQLEETGQFGSRPIFRVRITGTATVEDTVAAMILEPDVLVAEPNPVMQSPEARKNAAWAVGEESDYATLWAQDAIGLADAHIISTGAGVRIALLDTGVDPLHPGLSGRLIPGWDFVDNDNDASEVGTEADAGFGHGTHIAGIVTLVAPAARIMPLRVLDKDGMGNVWVIAEAMLYAVDPDQNPVTNDGARVINLSLGTLEQSDVLRAAVSLATCAAVASPAETTGQAAIIPAQLADTGFDNDKIRCSRQGGSVVVAAAGNDASKSLRQYPAAESVYGMISAGASDVTGNVSDFSNFGSWVDLFAPGSDITSFIPGGLYGTWSGTSMAAPFVTGTAALLKAIYPRAEPRQVTRRIEASATELCDTNELMLDTAAALGAPGTGGDPCP